MLDRMKSALSARVGRRVLRTGLVVMDRLGRALPGQLPVIGRGGFGIIHPDKIGTLERVADGVAMVHAFANVGVIHGSGGVLVVDVATRIMSDQAVREIRAVTDEPIEHVVYTHGHVDHCGGIVSILRDAKRRGDPRPKIWAHEAVKSRFERYRKTWAWNNEVNRRQFGMPPGAEVFPRKYVEPDETYRTSAAFELRGERVELYHAEAETDDATWVWLPERRVALVGDLIIHSMPNTGNPNKAQRHTLGWAEALDAIAAKQPQHILPGHGDPVSGPLAAEMLAETARALRYLHDRVLEMLNDGKWPDQIVDAMIDLPPDLASKKYLLPLYGCKEFVVRDVLRRYAGWWGGDPADLMPVPRNVVAEDVLSLLDRRALIRKAKDLVSIGEERRALHLAMLLERGEPDRDESAALVAFVLERLAEKEPSFIARNFYRAALYQRQRRS
jgi:alkyl sulfatase BDS1-like metallo-beta-lactamase superfamily hydrolase